MKLFRKHPTPQPWEPKYFAEISASLEALGSRLDELEERVDNGELAYMDMELRVDDTRNILRGLRLRVEKKS